MTELDRLIARAGLPIRVTPCSGMSFRVTVRDVVFICVGAPAATACVAHFQAVMTQTERIAA